MNGSGIHLNRVLISDDISPRCIEILEENGIEVTKKISLNSNELKEEIKKYDGLIVRSATRVTKELIEAAPNLKLIGRAGTGVDNIDVEAASEKGIVVMNTPGGNSISAAELTCAMIISLSRSIPQATASMKEGKWDRKKFMGNELLGKTLAIVGLGRIGKEVATRMQAFGMRTIGYDPITTAETAKQMKVEFCSLEEVWAQADYITVHVPLIPQTTNLINDAVLAKCKRGVRIVNCARGGIVDETALLQALNSGHVAGAGFDVFVEEPPADYSLARHPNVVSTPHLGANTVEAQQRVAEEVAEQFVLVAKGESLLGAVNAFALSAAMDEENQAWVRLARSLGALLGGLAREKPQNMAVEVTWRCPTAKHAVESFASAAIAVGLLESGRNEGKLNLVSAPHLAAKLGLKVSMRKESAPCCSLTVDLRAGAHAWHAVGTVQGAVVQLLEMDGARFGGQGATLLDGYVTLAKVKDASAAVQQVVRWEPFSKGDVSNMAFTAGAKGASWMVLCSTKPLPTDVLGGQTEAIVQFATV